MVIWRHCRSLVPQAASGMGRMPFLCHADGTLLLDVLLYRQIASLWPLAVGGDDNDLAVALFIQCHVRLRCARNVARRHSLGVMTALLVVSDSVADANKAQDNELARYCAWRPAPQLRTRGPCRRVAT